MSGRSRLPGAQELFRATGNRPHLAASEATADPGNSRPAAQVGALKDNTSSDQGDRERHAASGRRTGDVDRLPTRREKHDEKITVYCSGDELIELERARLALRGEYGIAVDRGRLVREAISLVLEDLASKGGESPLVARLRRD